MDSNIERIPEADADDWRSHLQPESRRRIVNKIMGTLTRHLPYSSEEGLQEIRQIAIRFEEKTYNAATSQSDYLRKISIKMLIMESKSKGAVLDALPSNPASVSTNEKDLVSSQDLQSHVRNQSQSVPAEPPQADTHPPHQMNGDDWRSQLQPASRQRIINKIVGTLEKHLPFYGPEGLQELNNIAIRFEEKTYRAATSQSDYLRKISIKMLTMESESKGALLNALPSNPCVSTNQQDPVVCAQVHNQSQCASADLIDL